MQRTPPLLTWGPLFLMLAISARAATAPALSGPDDRYKADILLVIPHSDDETVDDVAGYLARAIYDQHRRVAVVMITRNEGEIDKGSNSIDRPELGQALGAEREIEARRAFAFLGVTNVWFLNAVATTGFQDVLRSLETWDHGSVLGQVVRLIRLTRPEVILTFLPDYVAGENHAEHQAAGVIATEAFDMAGDPVAFGEQLAMEPEGLRPWQPKKLYYFSDSFEYRVPPTPTSKKHPPLPSPFRGNFLLGKGPAYSNTEISPAKQVPYSAISTQECAFYLTQQEGPLAAAALERHDYKGFEAPAQFIFGKSLVGGSRTGDIFEGIVPGPLSYQPLAPVTKRTEPALELGGPWHYYQEFWRYHHTENLATLLPIPEISIEDVDVLRIPLLIRNTTQKRQNVTLTTLLPQGWSSHSKYTEYPLMPGEVYPVQVVLDIPEPTKGRWQEVKWQISSAGRQLGETVTLRVYVGAHDTMPLWF